MINPLSSPNHTAAGWFKSSYSAPNNDCVEVANLTNQRIGVRDSKTVTGPVIVATTGAFASLVDGLRNGTL
ncbi:DUF397 domain-containing protein [Streptomyces niveus]|uniref:DUF397 domain-containing protein n=1 Tax=Streptomyces niveus TaxID=193462 RepID=UPI0036AF89BC